MEMTIGTDTVVMLAELLSALGVIGGVVLWLFKFVQRSRRQAEELKSIRKEQTLICYGLLACLKGLKEQGCNGPVTEAMNRIEAHLNRLRTAKRAEGKSCSQAFPRLPEKRRRLKHERILRYGERYIMNQIDWKRKLSFRKLWAAIAGIVTGLAMVFGLDESTISSVAGAVVSVASVVSYIITEGKVDAENVRKAAGDQAD